MADALSGILDDVNLPSTIMSSCELHVVRYRGPNHGEAGQLRTAAPLSGWLPHGHRHAQEFSLTDTAIRGCMTQRSRPTCCMCSCSK